MSTTTTAIIVLIAVALIGLLLRRGSSTPSDISQAPPPPPMDEPGGSYAYVEEDDADLDAESDETVAVTSDGWAFVPDGHEVQLVPPRESESDLGALTSDTSPVHLDRSTGALEEMPRGRALPQMKPGEHLDTGDLTAARVVRGAVDVDPWRLEALGREGEYRAWPFETQEAANAARDLLQQRIVRVPLDEDGSPRTPDEADYVMAIAMTEQGVADVATEPDDETQERP